MDLKEVYFHKAKLIVPAISSGETARFKYFMHEFITQSIWGSICQRLVSHDIARWNRWNSERLFKSLVWSSNKTREKSLNFTLYTLEETQVPRVHLGDPGMDQQPNSLPSCYLHFCCDATWNQHCFCACVLHVQLIVRTWSTMNTNAAKTHLWCKHRKEHYIYMWYHWSTSKTKHTTLLRIKIL